MYNFESQFSTCSNREQAQKLYRELSKQNHPDLGGCKEAMQALNAAYESWASCKASSTSDKLEREILRKLQDVLSAGLPDNVEIELIGSWVWVSGETKDHRLTLKELGLRWNNKRKMWYWTASKRRKRFSSRYDIEDVRARYGSRFFSTKGKIVA